jgi:D-aminopeptidase
MLPNDSINPVFAATVQAVEEAIVNALVGAETMKGFEGTTVYALPHDKLQEVLKEYNRMAKAGAH